MAEAQAVPEQEPEPAPERDTISVESFEIRKEVRQEDGEVTTETYDGLVANVTFLELARVPGRRASGFVIITEEAQQMFPTYRNIRVKQPNSIVYDDEDRVVTVNTEKQKIFLNLPAQGDDDDDDGDIITEIIESWKTKKIIFDSKEWDTRAL